MRIPADVERPDKLLAGLTARQLAILGVAAVALWAGYAATRHLIPPVAYGAAAIPVGAIAAMLALGRFEGVAADRWVSAAWRHHRAPHRLVPAPDGVPAAPAFLDARPGPTPAALRLPFAGVSADGVVDLGGDGLAVICRASAVTFSLRTPAEQEALVAGFARWLNSLDQPTQLLVRAEPVDLTPSIDALIEAAPGLPHVALDRAARGTPPSWPNWQRGATCCAAKSWSCCGNRPVRMPRADCCDGRAKRPGSRRGRRHPHPPRWTRGGGVPRPGSRPGRRPAAGCSRRQRPRRDRAADHLGAPPSGPSPTKASNR